MANKRIIESFFPLNINDDFTGRICQAAKNLYSPFNSSEWIRVPANFYFITYEIACNTLAHFQQYGYGAKYSSSQNTEVGIYERKQEKKKKR